MGLLDAGYALFEFTGQKLLDIYDILSSAPAIVKIFQNNPTKKNRRKEKGLAGKFLTPKRGIQKNIKHKIKSKDSHIIVTPRSQKLSLAITPSIKRSDSATSSSSLSTPAQGVNQHVSGTPAPTPAPEKIQKLESELTKLREEIAKLMSQPKASQTAAGGAYGTVSFPSQPVVPQSFVPPPPPMITGQSTTSISTPIPIPHHATTTTTTITHHNLSPSSVSPSSVNVLPPPPPPPLTSSAPPPPPPPPMTSDTPSTPKLTRSASHVQNNTPKNQMPRTMSLADVLKGASAANLRKTEFSKSPGGTPMDTPVKGNRDSFRMNDPQDFIAQALKKKFASINRYNTPETTQKRKQVDGDSGWDESPPPSPGRSRKSAYAPIAFVQDENVPPVENAINA